MKAAVCREVGQPLSIEEVAIAEPEWGEVKVKLIACAICHSDIMFIDGHWEAALPAVYGHEASGVIESVGPGVSNVCAGDHVVVTLIRSCGDCHYCLRSVETQCEKTFSLDERSPLSDGSGAAIGQGLNAAAFAEYAVVEQSQVCVIPRELPLDVASMLGCGVLTGFGAVANMVDLAPESTVAVIGCGGVGINSIQAAAVKGARCVIAIDVMDEKLEKTRLFGSTHTLNSSAQTFTDDVLALTEGRGPDYVFVTVGARSAIMQGMQILSRAGTLVIVGMPASEILLECDPGELASRGQSLVGSKMGSSSVSRDIPLLVNLYQEGILKLDELISGRYALQDINDAIDSVRRGEVFRNVVMFQ